MPYHRMTNRNRYEAIGMLRNMSVNDVAAHFNVHRSTISRMKQKFNQTGDVVDLPRSGRPKKTTDAEDRHIRTVHLRNRFRSASETARNWQGHVQISRQTVNRRLARRGLVCRRPVQKQDLLPHHVAARLAWATHHRRWTMRQWSRIIWSDEKRFPPDKKDGRLRCFRRRNESFAAPNIHQYGPRQSIMVWAAIGQPCRWEKSDNSIQRRVTARRYQDEALAVGLLPFLNQHNNQMQFMQDNASPHRAHATRDWLQNHNIDVFGPWPSKSPDMNPIENLWAQMENAIGDDCTSQQTGLNCGRPSERSGPTLTSLLFAAWCSPCADAAAPLWGRLAAIPNTESSFSIFLMIKLTLKLNLNQQYFLLIF